MSLAILGADGQLGVEFCKQLKAQGKKYVPFVRSQADLCNHAQVAEALAWCHDLDVVINCAAYTKVDLAEEEPDLCRAVNVEGVANLANICSDQGWLLVQISSDYVFGQSIAEHKPWRESDPTFAQSVYAKSKLDGERAAVESLRHLIVRTCGLYGPLAKPGLSNFVETMLRLGRERPQLRIVNDQYCTPSKISDIVEGVLLMVEHETRRDEFLSFSSSSHIVHLVNRGETSWYDFACEIFHLSGIATPITPITSAEFGAKAARPSYSVLDCSRYDRFVKAIGGPARRTWQEALAEYLKSRKNQRQ